MQVGAYYVGLFLFLWPSFEVLSEHLVVTVSARRTPNMIFKTLVCRVQIDKLTEFPTFHQPVSGPGMKKTGLDRQTSVVAPQCSTVVQEREAKRVRLLNFWAKRRIVQKGQFTYDVRKIDPLSHMSTFGVVLWHRIHAACLPLPTTPCGRQMCILP